MGKSKEDFQELIQLREINQEAVILDRLSRPGITTRNQNYKYSELFNIIGNIKEIKKDYLTVELSMNHCKGVLGLAGTPVNINFSTEYSFRVTSLKIGDYVNVKCIRQTEKFNKINTKILLNDIIKTK